MEDPNPTTPSYVDDLEFVEAYLVIHRLSRPSYRYAYLLWISIALVVLGAAALRHCGPRGGVVGTRLKSWAMRRRTWRRRTGDPMSLDKARHDPRAHRQPFSFPSNAQLLSLAVLAVVTLALCFAGPDYVSPSQRLWWRRTTTRSHPRLPIHARQSLRSPGYTISKAWWTVGGRTGLIAFALLPLVVLCALKARPFALFSSSFLLQLHFDKLAFLHRWSALLFWLLSTIHVFAWGVQIAIDRRGDTDNRVLWVYVWLYGKFIYGVVAYLCLCLLLLTSLAPLRRHFYEPFYALHVFLSPLTILMSALHFPPIAYWCWLTLGLWLGERLVRFARFVWLNKCFGLNNPIQATETQGDHDAWELSSTSDHAHGLSTDSYAYHFDLSIYSPTTPNTSTLLLSSRDVNSPNFGSIPRGHATAELLPGRTIRLHINPSRPFTWSPGQYVLLRIPSVSQWTTHPFTIVSVCNVRNRHTNTWPYIVLLIRAKSGFTRRLWNDISRQIANRPIPQRVQQPWNHLDIHLGAPPVYLKAQIDGPFGSSERVRWDKFGTVVIISGGAGVSFGLSILQHVCFLSSTIQPDHGETEHVGRYSAFNSPTHIRFIWIVREYSHLQWCAEPLGQCLKIAPSSVLTVEIFVTNIARPTRRRIVGATEPSYHIDDLIPPHPRFATGNERNPRQSWSSDAAGSEESIGMLTPITPISVRPFEDDDMHELDYTNFDGDDDTFLPGEARFSRVVHHVGHLRRRQSRATRLDRHCKRHPDPLAGQEGIILKPSRIPEHTSGVEKSSNNFRSPVSASPVEENDVSTDDEASGWTAEPLSPYQEGGNRQAMDIISELARPGKPNIKAILQHEGRGAGPMAVACCGPTSLTALVRKIVAAQTEQSGNSQSAPTLILEDYES